MEKTTKKWTHVYMEFVNIWANKDGRLSQRSLKKKESITKYNVIGFTQAQTLFVACWSFTTVITSDDGSCFE